MKANMRTRNLAVNSYVGILAITIVGSLATLYIVHVAYEAPLSAFASPATYDIGVNL